VALGRTAGAVTAAEGRQARDVAGSSRTHATIQPSTDGSIRDGGCDTGTCAVAGRRRALGVRAARGAGRLLVVLACAGGLVAGPVPVPALGIEGAATGLGRPAAAARSVAHVVLGAPDSVIARGARALRCIRALAVLAAGALLLVALPGRRRAGRGRHAGLTLAQGHTAARLTGETCRAWRAFSTLAGAIDALVGGNPRAGVARTTAEPTCAERIFDARVLRAAAERAGRLITDIGNLDEAHLHGGVFVVSHDDHRLSGSHHLV